MINRVILVGRLCFDPELRYTPNGVAVTRFRLAVQRTFTNKDGEREADFIDIVCWRGLAENVANYTAKGSLVGVDGRIQTRTYENQDGKTVHVTEVVAEDVRFLDSKKKEPVGAAAGVKGTPFDDDGKPVEISDDDLPF